MDIKFVNAMNVSMTQGNFVLIMNVNAVTMRICFHC